PDGAGGARRGTVRKPPASAAGRGSPSVPAKSAGCACAPGKINWSRWRSCPRRCAAPDFPPPLSFSAKVGVVWWCWPADAVGCCAEMFGREDDCVCVVRGNAQAPRSLRYGWLGGSFLFPCFFLPLDFNLGTFQLG